MKPLSEIPICSYARLSEEEKKSLAHYIVNGNAEISRQAMHIGCQCTMLESREAALPQVDALMAAGWTFELPDVSGPEPWQWYWRRPARRKGKKGRKFLSTNQAFNAMLRGAKSD